jgi:Ca2+-binding EF-hand superfamily protein
MRFGSLAAAAGVFVGAWTTAVVAGDAPDPAKAAQTWEAFAKQFDLDRDREVEWVEYQQVITGFAAFDADHDGSIDEDEFAKAPASGSFGFAGLGGVGVPFVSGSVRVGKVEVPDGADGLGASLVTLGDGSGECVTLDAGKCGPWMAVTLLGPKADSDHDGAITRAEWDALVGRLGTDAQGAVTAEALRGLLPTELPEGFETVVATSFFDADKDGKVTPADVRALFDAVDTDRDGTVGAKDAPPVSIQVVGGK